MPTTPETWENQYRPILTVLAAAGTGPVLPLPLLRLASEKLGGPSRIGSVRDTLVRLRRLVVRGRPGTEDEQVGLFHATLHDYLSAGRARYAIDVRRGHGAIHEAIDELVPHQATFARLTIRRRRGSLVWRFRQAM